MFVQVYINVLLKLTNASGHFGGVITVHVALYRVCVWLCTEKCKITQYTMISGRQKYIRTRNALIHTEQ